MANQPSTTHTLKQILKMGACCAGPILGLALLAPLANAVGLGGSSILSFLLLLACPASMYFMMRGMGGMRGHERAGERPLLQAAAPDSSVAAVEGNGQPERGEALAVSGEQQAPPPNEGSSLQQKRARLQE